MTTKKISHVQNIGRPPFSTILEYRGKVFSSGGDEGEYTIPNFLSTYGSISKGVPKGITLPLSKGKKLNRAVRSIIYAKNLKITFFFLKGEWS